MKARYSFIVAGALACTAQPVLANDYLFKGDCAAADEFRRSVSLSNLIPARTYTSVQVFNNGSDSCGRSFVVVTDLSNRRFEGSNTLTFDISRISYQVGKKSGTCTDPAYHGGDKGTFKFDIVRLNNSGTCEIRLRLSAAVTRTNAADVTWSNYITPLNGHSFVLNQPDRRSSNQFFSPGAFVATSR